MLERSVGLQQADGVRPAGALGGRDHRALLAKAQPVEGRPVGLPHAQRLPHASVAHRGLAGWGAGQGHTELVGGLQRAPSPQSKDGLLWGAGVPERAVLQEENVSVELQIGPDDPLATHTGTDRPNYRTLTTTGLVYDRGFAQIAYGGAYGGRDRIMVTLFARGGEAYVLELAGLWVSDQAETT